MKPETIKDWMKENRHSSYSFAEELRDKHGLEVSAETVQRWMRELPVSERHRKTVEKVTKLKIAKQGKTRQFPAIPFE